MATLGFCGLGQMGSPMAGRLVEAGHHLSVWNRTPGKAKELVERGAREASSPADAASGADGVITMLADPDALEQVVFGSNGIASGMTSGGTLIEMSTVGPSAVHRVAARLPDGVDMLDAPVLGSVSQARDGILKIFAGGSQGTCDRWFPALQAMGTPRRIGGLGTGAAMKVVVNSTLMVLMTGLAEAVALADRLGLDEPIVLDVLSDSPIGEPVRRKRRFIESGRYPPNFKIALARKDAGLVVETAEAEGLDLPLARGARAWMEAADQGGLGELDYSAVIAEARGKPART
jgi:3-hydroxyisobutyrate dehydrogenase-like beta-hydroxyacid dehydrogenase